jgi:hypothetical protein
LRGENARFCCRRHLPEITIIRRGQLTSAGAIIEPVREGQQMLVERRRLVAAVRAELARHNQPTAVGGIRRPQRQTSLRRPLPSIAKRHFWSVRDL